ncbi:MAG: hypothetical protein AAFO98_01385 [Pseudomonadota bacterium]
MTDSTETPVDQSAAITAPRRTLKAALYDVKTQQAERDDVVVEMKEAERARLELLADEVRPVLDDVDSSDERFDLVVTRGDRPRMWVDATCFVAMGADKRLYRLIKDGRGGRVVLEEADEMSAMADHVSHYIASRVLERERAIDGDWEDARAKTAAGKAEADTASVSAATATGTVPSKARSRWRSVFWFFVGVLATLVGIAFAAVTLVPDAF